MTDLLPVPTREQNPRGLHGRYNVRKIYGDTDPNAIYFVLRLDPQGDDPIWTSACRTAARQLAQKLREENHLTEVADDLYRLCEHLEKTSSGVIEPGAADQ